MSLFSVLRKGKEETNALSHVFVVAEVFEGQDTAEDMVRRTFYFREKMGHGNGLGRTECRR
jgi:hypothetical protein